MVTEKRGGVDVYVEWAKPTREREREREEREREMCVLGQPMGG